MACPSFYLLCFIYFIKKPKTGEVHVQYQHDIIKSDQSYYILLFYEYIITYPCLLPMPV